MQTITLRLRLHQPTKAKQAVYRELAGRVTGFANNLVAAGRPKKLTSKTAKPYCPDRIPSAVINQALRDVAAHPKVEKFRVLWPGFNNQNCRLERVGGFWTVGLAVSACRCRRLTGKHSYSPSSAQPSSKAQPNCMRSVGAGTWLSPSPSR